MIAHEGAHVHGDLVSVQHFESISFSIIESNGHEKLEHVCRVLSFFFLKFQNAKWTNAKHGSLLHTLLIVVLLEIYERFIICNSQM